MSPHFLFGSFQRFRFVNVLDTMKAFSLSVLVAVACVGTSRAQGPELTSWHINLDGATGIFWNGTTLTPTSNSADVQLVQHSADNVYVTSFGVPRYATAPYPDGNPSQAEMQDYLFRIPRNPEVGPAGGTGTGLGHTAVLVNGVPTFNALDAFSYNNQGVWNQNAIYFENAGFDCAKGHPAMGAYHHHQVPTEFSNSLAPTSDICDTYPSDGLFTADPEVHSPLIGWAFDGYPIYGPFGFANADGTGGIVRIETSYRLRDIADRTTLPDGTALAPNQYGPALDEIIVPQIPGAQPIVAALGAYVEDYEFVDGFGHLDEFNGRFAVTPEYPNGTYAYVATVDADWNGAYPYFFPKYRGVVATDNFGGNGPGGTGGTNVVITEDVTTYDPLASVTSSARAPRGWDVFPNPTATSTMTWRGTLPTRYTLLDAHGRVVLEGQLPAHATECLLELSLPGVYLLRGSDGQTARLVRQ